MKSLVLWSCMATASLAAFADSAGASADKAYKAAMDQMQTRMNGMMMMANPDQDFLMMMVPHHQSAIDMARAELKYGKDPKVRKLAADIIKAQQKEIETMNKWMKGHSHH